MGIGPKNLFSRFLLIIITPMFLLLVISTYIFYERHWENVSTRMQESLIGDIKLLIALRGLDDDVMLNASKILNFEVQILGRLEVLNFSSDLLSKPDHELKSFNARLSADIGKLTKSYYLKNSSRIETVVHDGDDLIIVIYSSKRIHSPTNVVFILWMSGTAVFLLIIAITFMKNQIRAIIDLAIAAERLGKGQETGRFSPSGASEVRIAGKAFLRMKERIERQISYRTELLTHISHDLRTPLTRMKLQLALMKNVKESEFLEQDVVEMEKMIEGYITFAKEEGNESAVMFDIVNEVSNIIKKFKGKRIDFRFGKRSHLVLLKREAFNRVMSNLLSNAQKYCSKRIVVSLDFTARNIVLIVEDDGDGIPEKYYTKVFEPFTKINSHKEGFGLGLAIIKNIVLGHGGKINLGKSNLGGLKVEVKIPL